MFQLLRTIYQNSFGGSNAVKTGFRADINGLRAVAVALVVLFHFGIPGFRGGYVGVDVFFVISGYLMTRIIVGGLRENRFSLSGFYLARARRIIPALAAVCLTLLIYGVLQMTPPDLERLGRHAVESMTFTSNIFYWSEFNYFDADNFDKWLLHTWSLSVEWQFYLLFPIILLFVDRLGKPRSIYICLVVLFATSFGASIFYTSRDSVFAFYMLPTRAWEMVAGGLVALTPAVLKQRHAKGLTAILGLALMAVATLHFDAHTRWPGSHAALPVLGACLYIYADWQSRLTRNAAVGAIGAASYSIYLWHWPVVALIHHHSLETSTSWVWFGIAASVVIGLASQLFIEAPALKTLQALKSPRSWALVLSGTGAVAALSVLMLIFRGLPERPNVTGFSATASEVAFPKMSTGWCHTDFSDLPLTKTSGVQFDAKYAECYIGDTGSKAHAILWGDSHAAHFAPYIDVIAKAQHVAVQQLTAPGCKPLFESSDNGSNPDICINFRKRVLEELSPDVKVIIGGRWDNAAAHADLEGALDGTLKRLQESGVKVILLGEVPVFPTSVDQKFIYERTFGVAAPHEYARSPAVDAVNETLKREAQKLGGITFINPAARLCTASTCTPRIDGHEAYFNADHLTIHGAQSLARLDLSAGLIPANLLVP